MVEIDADKAKSSAEKISRQEGMKGTARAFPGDVSLAPEAEKLVRDVQTALGGVDVLVNNAGIQRYGTAVSASEESWDEVLRVNLKSMFLMSKYALPEMIRRRAGAIVNVGSVQSLGAVTNSIAYVTSKHGVLGLTRSLAIDYGHENIRATCVCPGAMDTPMLRWSASLEPDPGQVIKTCEQAHALGRLGQADEVTRLVAFLASEEASFPVRCSLQRRRRHDGSRGWHGLPGVRHRRFGAISTQILEGMSAKGLVEEVLAPFVFGLPHQAHQLAAGVEREGAGLAQQPYTHLFGQAVPLAVVAGVAAGHKVIPVRVAPAGARDDVVQCKV